MNKQFALTDNSVVVVIGSGAGGGVLANQLAQNGVDVVCLEAGRRLSPADVVNDETEMFGKLTWLDPRISSGQTVPGLPVWTCKTVGGTTMHWTASCPRLQEHEFRTDSLYGDIPDTNLQDWPFDLETLSPYYSLAEDRMGVTGTHNIPLLPGNNNYKVLEAGARKLGYTDIDTNHVAINSVARDGRPACVQSGFCTSGCVIQAKWSTLYTEIPQAERSGHFELRPESMVVRIGHNAQGRVDEVHYLDSEGTLRIQKARAVCVACNAVETSRLLLNSTSDRFPNGLANSSDQVGRNYMRHFIASVVGEMPGPVNLHRGAHQAGIIRDEAGHNPERGFAGGILMLTVPFAPEMFAKFLDPNGWGEDYASTLENYDHLAAMLIHGEDLAQQSNRITLHPTERDSYGLPVPIVHYEEHPNTRRMKEYALKCGKAIYRALNAKKVHAIVDMLPATHNMGTARMGNDPATSVCNPWGQTHDIANLFVCDGSLFPSVGCGNPTLTIVALALRQADYLTRQLQENIL
ncbi:GMC family oxidoreductase [Parahaliea mediterranea]|uniref:GMC family oxidoreductase n=1 Tax=Parahaliea mediterranea TaxID=651086 RepID=UPI000E2F6810|nr:GMC family oxidoreductase [Parahaliea mediterranea]